MHSRVLRSLVVSSCLALVTACEKQPAASETKRDGNSEAQPSARGHLENIDAEERLAASKLKPAKDPILDEIYAFRLEVRKAYNNRSFDKLEQMAAEIRQKKEVFDNGSWKIVQFYAAFECRADEPDSMWKLHDEIHRAWIEAKPTSITANVSYADFLDDYAWNARGGGFADTVTEEGWRLFKQRLEAANAVLKKAKTLTEKDPYWALVALKVSRGQGWSKKDVDTLVEEATAAEPTFWGYHTERAFSLLPRWHGEPGDWEKYAEQAAARPNGLGDEAYARIVLMLDGYHENLFRESKASWPKTKEGLRKIREKYPRSLSILSDCAMLAGLAQDREFAKEMFAALGNTYFRQTWGSPERFVHVKHWAETGQW
jgi:hypothetical protein